MAPQKVALITGASSGIGAAFAQKLAAQNFNLILAARRQERLAGLAAALEKQYAICADILVADLAQPQAVEQVEHRITRLERLDLLVNNAGFGTTGDFTHTNFSRQLEMIHLHVLAAVRLTRAALPGMVKRGQGAIINVSSMAGFIPMPHNVTYCATKAFLNSFTEALHLELAGTGVQVQALCPGFTRTEFHNAPGFSRSRIPNLLWMPAGKVVDGSLKALAAGQVVCIPGFKNRLLYSLIHLTPAPLRRWALGPARRRLWPRAPA